jgi:alpha-tubulin suppressor-like RCC1 family protein
MGFTNNENNILLLGRNHKGQCAEPKEKDNIDVPSQPSFSRYADFNDYDAIDHDFPSAYVRPGLQFSNLYCQKLFTLAVTKDKKSLFACGVNDSGQLGLGVRRDQHYKLFRVPLPKGTIQDVYPGHVHSFIRVNDELFAFGANSFGQLGTGNDFNELLAVKLDQPNIKKVSCGLGHTALLSNDGIVYTAGRGIHGQLGIQTKQLMTFQPVNIPGEVFDDISCGYAHTIAVSKTGNVYVWGHGLVEDAVSFGGPSPTRTYNPKPDEHVPKLKFTIKNYESGKLILSSGGYFCTLYYPGLGMFSCGSGLDGQLGTGKREKSDDFVRIDHPENVVQISCGFNWVCSVTEY